MDKRKTTAPRATPRRKPGYAQAKEMIRSRKYLDTQIARECGYTRERVRQIRSQMNLPAIRWASRPFQAMGKLRLSGLDDRGIAARLRISVSEIRRVEKGVLAAMAQRHPEERPILPRLRSDFGRLSDKDLSARHRLPIRRVRLIRYALGYRAVYGIQRKPTYPRLVEMLKSCRYTFKEMRQETGYAIATITKHKRRLGISGSKPREAIKAYPGYPRLLELLESGRVTFAAMSRETGIGTSMITIVRRRLGLPALYGRVGGRLMSRIRQARKEGLSDSRIIARLKLPSGQGQTALRWFENRALIRRQRYLPHLAKIRNDLGQVSDIVLASQTGLRRKTIESYRHSLGILMSTSKKRIPPHGRRGAG